MCKPSDHFSVFEFFRWRTGLGQFDDRGEIFGFSVLAVCNVWDPRIARHACCENPVPIALLNGSNAVRGHQNRAAEGGKFLILAMPCVAVVPVEVRIFLKFRIGVGGEHFAVGIDVDSRIRALVEEFLEVAEIVSGDQNAGTFANPGPDLVIFG